MGYNTYLQDGLTIGSALSPVMANIYMKYFREIVIEMPPQKPIMWLSHGHDAFKMYSPPGRYANTARPCNSIRPPIQFPIEKEADQLSSWIY